MAAPLVGFAARLAAKKLKKKVLEKLKKEDLRKTAEAIGVITGGLGLSSLGTVGIFGLAATEAQKLKNKRARELAEREKEINKFNKSVKKLMKEGGSAASTARKKQIESFLSDFKKRYTK